MTERQLVSSFMKQIKKEFPWIYWYKMGDTFGGHRKPCDVISCIKGKFVAIEFKKGNGKLSGHQLKELNEIVDAGGIYLVGRFYDDYIIFDTPGKGFLIIKKEKGKYHHLQLDQLINFISES